MGARFQLSGLAAVLAVSLFSPPLLAQPYKVLAVMSYEADNPWVGEIREGIEAALGDKAEVTYFYMDTKRNPGGGPAKAKTAKDLLDVLKPHGVITADDNAQSMFVVPFLKGRADLPVMFSGVNAEPEKYGFPAVNVSGTLERAHVRETIAFVQQLKPSIKSVSFVVRDSPSGRALRRQINSERASYSAEVDGFHLVRTTEQLTTLGAELNGKTDALFIESLEGITDPAGQPKSNRELYDLLYAAFRGPIVGANRYHVEQGALTAVVKTGQEQGRTAARMLLKALQGTPVRDLKITTNHLGRRIINVTTMENLGLKPRPIDLRGATLVRTR